MTDNASIAADIADMNRLMKVYATFDAESLIAKLLNAEIDRLSDGIEAALKVETPDLTNQLARAIQAKTGGNVEGKIPEWWAEFIGMVLDELQSTGRLTPTGGMALTAEQVEDVRTAREALRGYRNFEGSISRGHVRGLIAAVDALFPVTEPAEPAASEGVNCGANSVVLGWCTLSAQHEGLHTNGTYFWGQAPAPAEPAEEETKAELL